MDLDLTLIYQNIGRIDGFWRSLTFQNPLGQKLVLKGRLIEKFSQSISPLISTINPMGFGRWPFLLWKDNSLINGAWLIPFQTLENERRWHLIEILTNHGFHGISIKVYFCFSFKSYFGPQLNLLMLD